MFPLGANFEIGPERFVRLIKTSRYQTSFQDYTFLANRPAPEGRLLVAMADRVGEADEGAHRSTPSLPC